MARIIRPYDLILDADAGWRELSIDNVTLDSGRIELRTLANLLPALTDEHGTFGGHTLPRGVAVWEKGREIFIADPENHAVWRWQPCCGPAQVAIGRRQTPAPATVPVDEGCDQETSPRPVYNARVLNTPTGLAVHGNDLVVVDSGSARVLIFTLPGLALRRIIGPFKTPQPEPLPALTWQPIDAAAGSKGALYVLDAGGRVWKLDRQGRPDKNYAGDLPEDFTPARIQVDGQGRVYLVGLDGVSIVMLDRYGQMMPQPGELRAAVDRWLCLHNFDILTDACPPTPADELAGRRSRAATFDEETEARTAVLPPELSTLIEIELNRWMTQESNSSGQSKAEIWSAQRLELYEHDPPHVIAQAYSDHLGDFLHSVLPGSPLQLAEIVGKTMRVRLALPCPIPPVLTDLYVDANGHLDGTSLYLLHRPPSATFQPGGLFRTEALDSQYASNPWHRVVLELTIPDRTGVRLFSFTSDVPRPDLSSSGLLDEPPRTGPWQAAVDNIDEWLIQSPPGRYLYLALALKGPGDRTPGVERIYVYAQRQSSLRFLPDVFQEDEISRHLLDRMLSLFDTLYGEIEDQIEQFPLLMDITGAPPDFLPWLASWFDLTLEASWTDAQKRAFLSEIVDLYAWRGTPRGLKRLLQLHTGLSDPQPRIIEHFRGIEDAALAAWLGDVNDPAHHFTVVLPTRAMNTVEKRGALRRLIDANKPAHTHYTLRPMHFGVWLGGGSTRASSLGLDTTLGSPQHWHLPAEDAEAQPIPEMQMMLPEDAVPVARLGAARMGSTRLGGKRK